MGREKAIKKLRELSKEKPKFVKQWLSKQAFWQVHSPPAKHTDRPHYEVLIPNEMHQFDLLYMPSNTLYGHKYKQVKDVADTIADIYKVGSLTYLKVFQCNNGNESKAEVPKMLEKHGVTIQCAMMRYKHTHTAFVEALNKLLTEQLFKVQELNDYEKVS